MKHSLETDSQSQGIYHSIVTRYSYSPLTASACNTVHSIYPKPLCQVRLQLQVAFQAQHQQ